MREYMQIGLQYSIESLSTLEKKKREREVFTASQSKNQPLRERERRRRRRNERRKEEKKEDSRRKHCVYISLLPLVLDIPLSLTIKQQYQISSLATFLGNQVSISFYSYNIIYISIVKVRSNPLIVHFPYVCLYRINIATVFFFLFKFTYMCANIEP
jgi:hypothetical protein